VVPKFVGDMNFGESRLRDGGKSKSGGHFEFLEEVLKDDEGQWKHSGTNEPSWRFPPEEKGE